jgi:hypothetical protein
MDTLPPEGFGPICDATLVAFAWERDGFDLTIELAMQEGARRYNFTWVDHLSISIQQQPKGPSQPLSWEGNAERLPGGRLSVLLDFADQGAISFECNDIMAQRA